MKASYKIIVFAIFLFIAGYAVLQALPRNESGERILNVPLVKENTDHLLLPDLMVYEPSELYIQKNAKTGIRELRFDTRVINQGKGKLEVKGIYEPHSTSTKVSQVIDTVDGSAEEHMVGRFVFHPEHEHWHFEDFSQLELWTYNPDGSLDELVTSTQKITSCIRDSNPAVPAVTGAPAKPVYGDCDEDDVQGISIGWTDTYEARIPGQALDLSRVADGYYAAKLKVDPLKLLKEMHKDNNDIVTYISIKGYEVMKLPGPLLQD